MTIARLEVRDPKSTPLFYWPDVKFLKKVTEVEFKPGLNIIYGENGTGKSTLLKALAILTHSFDTAWPVVSKTSVLHFQREPLAQGLLLHHDGAPARYFGVDDNDKRSSFVPPDTNVLHKPLDLADPVTKSRALGNQSTGQAHLTKLSRLLSYEPLKTRYAFQGRSSNEELKNLYAAATESLKNVTKSKHKQSVFLLDEFETSLDFQKQARVWNAIDQLVATGEYQFIVASHSPWAARYTEDRAHYIETSPGYLERSRAALKVLFS